MSAYINGPVVVRLTADTEGEHNHDSCEEHPVHKLVLSPRHAQNKTRKSFTQTSLVAGTGTTSVYVAKACCLQVDMTHAHFGFRDYHVISCIIACVMI